MTVATNVIAPDLTEIVKGQLYIGNLSFALSNEERRRWSISHIVSVCPNFPSTGPNHLNIPVEDTEYDDLLIKLPEACAFIEKAIEQGGRVLVHCVMGISRSSTVVAAFLMKTLKVPPSVAISQLKKARLQAHPNYGFLKQLDVFATCEFHPSPSHPAYLAWKRRHVRDVTRYLNYIADTVSIVPEKLLLNSEFPTDPMQAQSLLSDTGVTHLLSISAADIPPCVKQVVQHHHITLDCSDESLALQLPTIYTYVSNALSGGGMVLIYSMSEARACMAAGAYLMATQRYSVEQALRVIEDVLPLFNPTCSFTRTLEAFQANGYQLSPKRPREDSSSQHFDKSTSSADLQKAASLILHDTGLDIGALGEALDSICQSTPIRVQ